MAKELGLHQLLGNGGAVDFDERFVRARAQGMQRVGHEFFAGSVLASDEDVGVGRRDASYQLEGVLHPRVSGDQIAESCFFGV
jgi:hypothetical protein